MRSRGRWAATLVATLLVVLLALDACAAATSVASPSATRAAIPSPTASGQVAGHVTIAWTAFAGDGAIQVWVAASDDRPRLLTTLT